jgi:hypothetical protein
MVTFLSDSFFFLFFLSTHSQHFYGKENKCSAPNRGDNSWPFQLGCVLVLPKNKKKTANQQCVPVGKTKNDLFPVI